MLYTIRVRSLLLTVALSISLFLPTHASIANAALLRQNSVLNSDEVGEFKIHLPALSNRVSVTPPVPSPNVLLAAGDQFTCALNDTTDAYCWGGAGRLGDGTKTLSAVPVAVEGLASDVKALDADSFYACALLVDHSVSCWGAIEVADPIRIANASPNAWPNAWQGDLSPVAVGGFAGDVAAISVHGSVGCAVLTTGAVQCWTRWANEQNETVTGLESGVVAIAKGLGHQCALLANGIMKCWGGNSYQQVGNGGPTLSDIMTPVEVVGLEDRVKAIAAGGFNSCALLENGIVQCWGKKINDDTYSGLPPTRIEGFSAPISAIDVGIGHSCALLVNGEVACWGENELGQLGNGSTVASSTPVKVVNVEGAVAIELGDMHSCALLEGNQIKCWGSNNAAQLGNGSQIDSSTPVTTTWPPQ